MASGGEVPGEVPGQIPDSGGSEDLDNLKCQLCLEDGLLHEAVGMCVDCNDVLCEACYKGHRRSRHTRNHQLIDKEQMVQNQMQASMKDSCTEKCEVHEDEIIKYYCTRHGLLGCTVCVTLGHTTCKDVHYIPHVAKELASNEEYRKTEKRLNEALETFKKVSDNADQYTEELETSCAESLKSIREFRRVVDEALGQLEAEMIEKVEAIKAEQMKELVALGKKYRSRREKLQSELGKVEALQQAGQNCSVFTMMMRIKEKLATLDAEINEAMRDTSYQKPQIRFTHNQDTLEMMKHSATFGNITESVRQGSSRKIRIVQATHTHDLYVKERTDKKTCYISGLATFPDGRLLLIDTDNESIKAVNVQSGQILSSLKLPSWPWDISAISSIKVAVTITTKKEVVIIALGGSAMSIDRTIAVNGKCWGVDYKNDKLVVSFSSPPKVEVLSLQGSVLHTLSTDKLGKALFSCPLYLTYGHDDSTLFASDNNSTVVCVKLDGTIVATYTDPELKSPNQLVVTSNGDVLVCAKDTDTVHQISKDCKKIRVLMNRADGLKRPYSICLSEEKGMIYVGMISNDNVMVYKIQQEPQ